MKTDEFIADSARRLLRLGILLFLLGLVTGFLLPLTANPRMALSSHLEGILNGLFLLVLGLIWHRLELNNRIRCVAFYLAVFGTFTNWGTTLVSAFLGAGAPMMPLAAAGHTGSAVQELLITIALGSLSVAMVAVGGIVFWGLRPTNPPCH